MKTWIIRTLLRLYPANWRREYGAEFADMLLARPLTSAMVADVLRNGLWQRLRASEASTRLGLAMLLVILGVLVWNLTAPPSNGHNQATLLLQDPSISYVYILVLIGCGCLTRTRDPAGRPGVAAMRASFIAGIPMMLVGVLILFGVLGVAVVGPGETATAFGHHGFAYTYYSAQNYCWIRVTGPPSFDTWLTAKLRALQLAACPPTPLGFLISPLIKLPSSWIWGIVGGVLGRWIARGRRRPMSA
jgi:hypothetical protein